MKVLNCIVCRLLGLWGCVLVLSLIFGVTSVMAETEPTPFVYVRGRA